MTEDKKSIRLFEATKYHTKLIGYLLPETQTILTATGGPSPLNTKAHRKRMRAAAQPDYTFRTFDE